MGVYRRDDGGWWWVVGGARMNLDPCTVPFQIYLPGPISIQTS